MHEGNHKAANHLSLGLSPCQDGKKDDSVRRIESVDRLQERQP